MTDQERIDGLLRHINAVKDNCSILANKLMLKGEGELARRLIQVSQVHDADKFSGIAWEFLTGANTTNRAGLKYAIEQHEAVNPHHPRYWGGIIQMPDIYLMEFACDIKARSTEFGTDLRAWIDNSAVKQFKMPKNGPTYIKLMTYVDMLCPKPFEPIETLELPEPNTNEQNTVAKAGP